MGPRKPRGSKKLSPAKVSKVIKVFESLGYEVSAQDRSSHLVMRKAGVALNLSIPIHGPELDPPILRSLIRNAGLTPAQFLELLDQT